MTEADLTSNYALISKFISTEQQSKLNSSSIKQAQSLSLSLSHFKFKLFQYPTIFHFS